MMEPVYYTVDSIDGDYAHMISDSGVENQVAMFLLPEGTDVGSRLVRENTNYGNWGTLGSVSWITSVVY